MQRFPRPSIGFSANLRWLHRVVASVALVALVALAVPTGADAQVRRGRAVEQPAPPWQPIAVGVRFGWDNRANGEVLGGQVRIPVLRNGVVELVPNADMIFLNNSKEYHYGADLSLVPGGPAGGIFVSGGIAWRDTPLGRVGGRQTYFGWVATLGGKTGLGPIELEAAIKWVFLNDTSYQPNAVTIGVNLPLWRRAASTEGS